MGRSRELDALESLGEAFQEACEHALSRPSFRGLRLGPLEELRMADLWPGELGWRRALLYRGDRSDAGVLCLLCPDPGDRGSAPSEPMPGRGRDRFSFLEILSGPPWRIVAAEGTERSAAAKAQRLARAVVEELRAE